MSKSNMRKLSGWLLVGYWTALFVGTHIRLDKLPGPEGSDKVMHFGAYFGLQVLLLTWLTLREPLARARWAKFGATSHHSYCSLRREAVGSNNFGVVDSSESGLSFPKMT